MLLFSLDSQVLQSSVQGDPVSTLRFLTQGSILRCIQHSIIRRGGDSGALLTSKVCWVREVLCTTYFPSCQKKITGKEKGVSLRQSRMKHIIISDSTAKSINQLLQENARNITFRGCLQKKGIWSHIIEIRDLKISIKAQSQQAKRAPAELNLFAKLNQNMHLTELIGALCQQAWPPNNLYLRDVILRSWYTWFF